MSEEHKKLYNFFLSGAKISSNRKPESIKKEIRYSLSLMENVKLVSGDSLQWVTRRTVDGVNYVITKQAREYEEDGISISPKPEYFIAIEAPEKEVEKEEPVEKEEIKKRLEELWAQGVHFTPGFFIDELPESGIGSSYGASYQTNVAVCAGGKWDVFFMVTPALCRTYDPGEYVSLKEDYCEKPAHIRFNREDEELTVAGLQNVADVNYVFYSDWDPDGDYATTEETDFNPGPLPWMGSWWRGASGGYYDFENPRADGSYDYLIQRLGYPVKTTPQYEICVPKIRDEHFYSGSWPESGRGWESVDYGVAWTVHLPNYQAGMPGEVIHNKTNPCKKSETKQEVAYAAIRCGHGHLFSHWYALGMYEDWAWNQSYIMGICFGNPSCISKHIQFIGEETDWNLAGRQEREKFETWGEEYFITDYATETRTVRGFKAESELNRKGIATRDPCATYEFLDSNFLQAYPYANGYRGGTVDDDWGSEKLNEAWFYLYTVEEYVDDWRYKGEPWSLFYYGYDKNGVYHNGDWGVKLPTWEELSRMQQKRYLLYIHIEGEDILLDELPWADYGEDGYNAEFYGLESQIFDFYGVPVYIYSYSCSPTGQNEPEYVRYGYFMGSKEIHIQSEKYPCGEIKNDYGRRTTRHDVFGLSVDSEEKENFIPKYADGGCAGFAVHRKHKTAEFEHEILLRE